MNIYECLGLKTHLMNLDISTENIIKSISDLKIKQESERIFAVIKNIKLQFSIHQGECCFQVIEIELSAPENINEISRIMQQVIKYRILFVFTFDDRYLLLWRNNILTENTEYVYTTHTVQCTNWIYAESLHEDILFNCDIHSVNNIDDDKFYVQSDKMNITDNDNCDTQYFYIVLNAIRLNNCIVNSDIVCTRYLIDWLQNHRIRENISIYEISAEMLKNENFLILGDNIFFEKSILSNVINTLENSQFLHTFGATGRYPMEYFSTITHPATYEDEYDLFSKIRHAQKYIAYDENEYVVQFDNDDKIKKVPVQCGGVICSSDAYSTPQNSYINDIIRRFNLRGYKILEGQNMSGSIIRKLRHEGYQVLEQMGTISLGELPILTFSEKIELLVYMDKQMIRFTDCSYDKYPSIYDFINETIKYKERSAFLMEKDWSIASFGKDNSKDEQIEKELQIVSTWCNKMCTFLETYNEADNQQMGNNQEVKGVLNMVQDPSIDKKLAITLEELDLSVRSYNCLKRAGIHTVNDIVNKSVDELFRVRNLSTKCVEEIIEKITKLGFELGKGCKYCYTPLTDEDLSFDDDLCAICRARELRTSNTKDITLEILPPELSSYTRIYSGFHIFVNIRNNTDKPLKLELKECSILKDGRQQAPKSNLDGYVFNNDYIFPNTIKTFAKIWEAGIDTAFYPDIDLYKGDYLTICLENSASKKIYFFKYEYHKSENNWYFYDYYEIE